MDESVRRPGRPRSEAARRAILDATAQLLVEDGYSHVTIDRIAARAACGRQTIYRWWPTKADVVLDAAADRGELAVPVPDEGGYAADLRAFLRTAFGMAGRRPVAELLTGLLVEAQLRPEFGARFRTAFLEPRRRAFRALLERASARGELPPRPGPDVVADVVFGVLWYRLLATGQGFDERLVEDLADLLTRAGSEPATTR